MSDDLAKKLPKTFVSTREFDHFRKDAEEYAALLERNGSLLAKLYIQPGASHCSESTTETLPCAAEH